MKIAKIPITKYSRFHFGELKLDDNLALSTTSAFAHSDTLFSALVHSAAKQYDDLENTFIKYFEEGIIKISSLFYYLEKAGKTIYFLPKPIFLELEGEQPTDDEYKKRNKIRFISQGVWEAGFGFKDWFVTDDYVDFQQKFLLTKSEMEALQLDKDKDQIFKIVSNPKSPQRSNVKAAIFYQTDVEIGGHEALQIGFYFAYQAESEAETMLKTATNIMAYTGIGGEINNMGRTTDLPPEFKEMSLEIAGQSIGFTNLSLFHPQNETELQALTYSTTFWRGGRKLVHGGQAKVVRMVKEMALFKTDAVQGQLVELGTDAHDHPIYRHGMPLLIPIGI